MEHADGGNLCAYIKRRKRLNEAEARRILIQLLEGVSVRTREARPIMLGWRNPLVSVDQGITVTPGRCGNKIHLIPRWLLTLNDDLKRYFVLDTATFDISGGIHA